MIKFIIKGNPDLIGLCLSESNIELLKKDNPIFIEGDKLELDHNIIIMYGNTEQEMEEKFFKSGLLNSNTKISRSDKSILENDKFKHGLIAIFATALLHYKKVCENGIDAECPKPEEIEMQYEKDQIIRQFATTLLDSVIRIFKKYHH